MFKDGISLPSLAIKIMFSYPMKDFTNKYIHQEIESCWYRDFTNWNEKKSGYIIQDKEKIVMMKIYLLHMMKFYN